MKSFNELVKKITVLSESDASRDDRAEKAGRKVTKDLEYDMYHTGKDDNKAERAGKRVTKDIEYDEKKKVKEESTDKRDNRAEKAGRSVAHDIEYDERKKDGIHGSRRDAEDAKAERAGKKVAKSIEWDEMHEDMDQAKQQKGDDIRDAVKNFNPRPAQRNECGMCEDQEHSPVVRAITNRIIRSELDLLSQYGPQAVLQAIDDVAGPISKFYGPGDEIGSSDVSGWVKQVKDSLESQPLELSEASHQLKRVVMGKRGGMIGEIGIDHDSPAGQGPFYFKHFSSGEQQGGFDSEEDAMNELNYYQNLKDKGYSESTVCEDDNISDEVWLTAKNIESQYDLTIDEFGDDELQMIADKVGLDIGEVAQILELEYDDGEMSDADATGMRDAWELDEVSRPVKETDMGQADRTLRSSDKSGSQYMVVDKDGKKVKTFDNQSSAIRFALTNDDYKVKRVVSEKSTSQSQARMMAAAAHNPKFAKKVGVDQSVAREFNRADTGKNWSKLPKHVDEADYDFKKAMKSDNPRIQKKGIGGAMDAATKRIKQTFKDVPLNSLEKSYKEVSEAFSESEYREFNRRVNSMISESITVNTSFSTGEPETGVEPMKTLNITASGEDADLLSQLLGLAGVQSGEQEPEVEIVEPMSQQAAMSGADQMVDISRFDEPVEPCEICGESSCECESLEENQPDWPSEPEYNDDAFMYSGGLNKPKAYKGSTGQTTRAVVGTVSMDESVELERSLWSLYKQVK